MGLFSWLGKLFGSPRPPTPPTPSTRTASPTPTSSPASPKRPLAWKTDGEQPATPATPAVTVRAASIPASAPPPIPASAPAPARPAGRPQPPQSPASGKLNLDAGQFAPLSGADIKKAGRGIGGLLRSPWFGRRDLIPPVSDPRTALIDRGMVGAGIITPEQLVEIHEIGAQMDELRPDLLQASAASEDAARLDKEERARRKEQKRAEAAQRKQRHAEDVARRKLNDIVFAGRGVSGGLADRRANPEKLHALQLPLLATPADLAAALQITIPRLRWLAFHSEATSVTHYVRFQVPKKSGGTRELAAPHHDLAACQEWILANILEKIPVADSAHGFVPGRSTLSNAVPHVGRKVVVNLDLKDFFPSITFPRVKGIFQGMGFSPAVATLLALLCTECPRRKVNYAGRVMHVATGARALPQGACTSPALSNLISRRLDARLAGVSRKLGYTYTRYADDLTFSCQGDAAGKVGYLLSRVRHLVTEEHLTVNESKTRIQRPGTQQTVTGIVVNQRPNVRRRTARRLRAILHEAKTKGMETANRERRDNFEPWLGGMIAYVRMVNPEHGAKLKAKFDALSS